MLLLLKDLHLLLLDLHLLLVDLHLLLVDLLLLLVDLLLLLCLSSELALSLHLFHDHLVVDLVIDGLLDLLNYQQSFVSVGRHGA